jgi:hypothetical protein
MTKVEISHCYSLFDITLQQHSTKIDIFRHFTYFPNRSSTSVRAVPIIDVIYHVFKNRNKGSLGDGIWDLPLNTFIEFLLLPFSGYRNTLSVQLKIVFVF